jgi:AcrR family transcriptional regulator
MARWEPNARERLQQAAMELFQERGYDRTTVEGIAARAGLTERTFFRYFADKREVLFSGAEQLQKLIVTRVAEAPAPAAPLEAVAAALEAAGGMLEEHRGHKFARMRYALLEAHADLRERELIKLASLAEGVADALRRRGVAEPAASLAAEAGIAAFKVGFQRWIGAARPSSLAHQIRAVFDELGAIAAVCKRRRSPGGRGRRSDER